MSQRVRRIDMILAPLWAFLFLLPVLARGGETPTMIIEEAKGAIEQAKKVGADRKAPDDFSAAHSWLARAEKEYAARKSFFSRTLQSASSEKAKEEEIIYLAKMSKLKAMTAEAKARKGVALADLKDARKDLADYQSALEVLKKKLAEMEKARGAERLEQEKTREAQARAEAARQELEKVRQRAVELEAQKKRELEEIQKKMSELETLKQKEIQESRVREAERAAQKEKELGEARLKAEQLALQQAQKTAEVKAGEEKLAAEREKLAALQAKAAGLERQRTILAEAGKIPQATVKATDKEIILTLLAINLFTPANELKAQGKEILKEVVRFLKAYETHKVAVRGHTDSSGTPSGNQTVSEKRAQKVREYLILQDIVPARITAAGLGPSQPIADNSTEAGRALNRRVEIAILAGEGL